MTINVIAQVDTWLNRRTPALHLMPEMTAWEMLPFTIQPMGRR